MKQTELQQLAQILRDERTEQFANMCRLIELVRGQPTVKRQPTVVPTTRTRTRQPAEVESTDDKVKLARQLVNQFHLAPYFAARANKRRKMAVSHKDVLARFWQEINRQEIKPRHLGEATGNSYPMIAAMAWRAVNSKE